MAQAAFSRARWLLKIESSPKAPGESGFRAAPFGSGDDQNPSEQARTLRVVFMLRVLHSDLHL